MTRSEQQTDARQQEAAIVETGEVEAFLASTPPTFTGDHAPEEAVGGTNIAINQKGGRTVKHLYRVTSRVWELRHGGLYGYVDIDWFCVNRPYPFVRPEEGIEDYDENGEGSFHARDYLNQHFSRKEAIALKGYLSRFTGITGTQDTTIKKVALPISMGRYSQGFKELLSDNDRSAGTWVPDGYDENALPFTVSGYYNVDGKVPRTILCPDCGKEIEVEDPFGTRLDTSTDEADDISL